MSEPNITNKILLSIFFVITCFSTPSTTFLKEVVLESKTLLIRTPKNQGIGPFPYPFGQIWAPPGSRYRCCRQCCSSAGVEFMPPVSINCYLILKISTLKMVAESIISRGGCFGPDQAFYAPILSFFLPLSQFFDMVGEMCAFLRF